MIGAIVAWQQYSQAITREAVVRRPMQSMEKREKLIKFS